MNERFQRRVDVALDELMSLASEVQEGSPLYAEALRGRIRELRAMLWDWSR